MKPEDQFVQKCYYETFIKEGEERHPLEVLGEAFEKENALENADLSYIRFAQGEIYFHYKDYEAAVFKWESIHNDFEPWAQKTWGMLILNSVSAAWPKKFTSRFKQTPSC